VSGPTAKERPCAQAIMHSPSEDGYNASSAKFAASMPSTRSEAIASELRRMIQSGELAPGERLRQLDIAAQFGTSTTPVAVARDSGEQQSPSS